MVIASAQTFAVPPDLHANLQEIGRYVEDHTNGEIDAPRTAALRMFATDFIAQHREDFEDKGDGQYVYVGSQDGVDDGPVADGSQDDDGGGQQGEEDDGSSTARKMTFSLSDRPSHPS